jgi:hypothetical protein
MASAAVGPVAYEHSRRQELACLSRVPAGVSCGGPGSGAFGDALSLFDTDTAGVVGSELPGVAHSPPSGLCQQARR